MHAYVSGVFTQEYNETAADWFGRLNELAPADIYSNQTNPGDLNMDLWNNSVGRKYGKKTKNRDELLKLIHHALKNGELITDPNDKRKYEGASHLSVNQAKPVIVLVEDKNGRNQIFYDTHSKKVFTSIEFVALIEAGSYPGYTVKTINGIPTPVSKRDSHSTNNLG